MKGGSNFTTSFFYLTKMKIKELLLFTLSLFVFVSCMDSGKQFKQLLPEQTGITFNNSIPENDSLNILTYEYIFNGGGVATADFNNDGLTDVYFTGNAVSNKLYLNKGEFKFEDITEKSKSSLESIWASGVATVDINDDGLMDIYVCATGPKNWKDKQNKLLVNQGVDASGIPVFKEMAQEYGLADSSHTTQAAFFDYDNDGDLDVYLMINRLNDNTIPNQYQKKIEDGTSPRTDKLLEAVWEEGASHPEYVNVSNEAGITKDGYGLGLNISDINKDGWKDIYVTNDYLTNDLLYINTHNKKFEDKAGKYLKHTSYSAMGNDVADLNNDALPDIISLDMMPRSNHRKKTMTAAGQYITYQNNEKFNYLYQYPRNNFQLNRGYLPDGDLKQFSEIGLLCDIAETDWSWSPLIADFDNDGFRDLIITNGFPRDITDQDFVAYRNETGYLQDKFSLLEVIPEVKLKNYAYRNRGNLNFDNVTDNWGIETASFSNGAAYADLDNDGDLDYVVNNVNDPAFVYENKGNENSFLKIRFEGDAGNKIGYGAVIEAVGEKGNKYYAENSPQRGYLSSMEPLIYLGLGKEKQIKELKVKWYNGKMQTLRNVAANNTLILSIKNANETAEYTHLKENLLFENISTRFIDLSPHTEWDFIDFNVQTLLPSKLSQLGPGMAVGDIDNDGLDDIYVGGPRFQSGYFLIQHPNGNFTKEYRFPKIDSISKKGEDLGSLLFDADQDGDLDLFICRGGNEYKADDSSYVDLFYINNGKDEFDLSFTAIPANVMSTSTARALDFDKDGDLDLIVFGRNVPQQYPRLASSIVLRNDSNKGGVIKFTDVTNSVAADFRNLGMVTDAIASDVDNDGWTDLVLASEWAPIRVFRNKSGVFEELKETGLTQYLGLWSSINAADFDHDGDIDYVVGNMGTNNLMKPSLIHPYEIIAGDLDKNGTFDLIPFAFFSDVDGIKRSYSYFGKDEVAKQLNATRSRFTNYSEFAKANKDNLLLTEERQNSLSLKMNFSESAYIENKGNGKFTLKALPILAQFSAVNGIQVFDFTGDGFPDILISGNNYGNEPGIGRYDASNGLLLAGDGKGNFNPIENSGFYAPGDAKALVSYLDNENNLCFLQGQNRGEFLAYKLNSTVKSQKLPKNKQRYSYQMGKDIYDGEIYFGSSYLGQSTGKIIVPSNANSVTFK